VLPLIQAAVAVLMASPAPAGDAQTEPRQPSEIEETPPVIEAAPDDGSAALGIAFEALGGIEGAVDGPAGGLRRTRTVLLLGPEGTFRGHLLTLLLRGEVEPAASIGGELRYGYRVIDELVLDARGAAVLAPETLFGAGLGLAYRPRLSDLVELGIGPAASFWFAGGDLPEETPVLWQATLGLSLHLWP
jgi:hypothetical protein